MSKIYVVTFRQVNSEFNKAYADEYNFGRESNENMHFHWSNTSEVEGVTNVKKEENVDFALIGVRNDGTQEEVVLKHMTVLTLQVNDGSFVNYAVSTDLLDKDFAINNPEKNKEYFYFTLKDGVNFKKLTQGVIVSEKSVSKKI